MEPGPICTQPQPCDWHPRIDSVVYHGMDWNCPTFTSIMGEQIQKFHGQLTPEVLISDVIAKVTFILYQTVRLNSPKLSNLKLQKRTFSNVYGRKFFLVLKPIVLSH